MLNLLLSYNIENLIEDTIIVYALIALAMVLLSFIALPIALFFAIKKLLKSY